MKLTKREKQAIEALEEVAKIWPESLWLYIGESFTVMKKDKNGNCVMKRERVDQDYIVAHIEGIQADGGGW